VQILPWQLKVLPLPVHTPPDSPELDEGLSPPPPPPPHAASSAKTVAASAYLSAFIDAFFRCWLLLQFVTSIQPQVTSASDNFLMTVCDEQRLLHVVSTASQANLSAAIVAVNFE
jgi:hypothetical protein